MLLVDRKNDLHTAKEVLILGLETVKPTLRGNSYSAGMIKVRHGKRLSELFVEECLHIFDVTLKLPIVHSSTLALPR